MQKKRRPRIRKLRPRAPSAHVGGEALFLAEMSLILSVGAPRVGGEVNPHYLASYRSFAFADGGLRGVYDSATGRIAGATFDVLPLLHRAAWGDDDWFESEFLAMVPPPEVKDVRGVAEAVGVALAVEVSDFAAGDPEVVVRLSMSDFMLAFTLRKA